MVSTPQTPTHGALAKFRTEVPNSVQMLTSWASFKSEGHPCILQESRIRVDAARPVPWGHTRKRCWERQFGEVAFYWQKVKPFLMPTGW